MATTVRPLIQTPLPPDVPGAWFDQPAVDRVIDFLSHLRHTVGRWQNLSFVPTEWQVEYLLGPVFGWKHPDGRRIIRTVWFEIPRKNGKGLDSRTPVLGPNGWTTMGALRPGDLVYAPDGTPTRVRWVSERHHRPCYQVRFADGAELVADDEHLWAVNDRYRGPVVVDTPTLHAKQRAGARGDRRYSVTAPAPIEGVERALPFDPYLFGLWLGDGSSRKAEITSADAELPRAFEAGGFVLSFAYTKGRATTRGILGLSRILKDMGVWGQKHVPDAYLFASEKQRLALLRGLMDTDGSVNRGPSAWPRVEFTSTNERLATAALFLARSLGWKATIKESRAMLNGRDCGPRWRVSWTAYRDESPFSLARKTELLQPRPERPTRAATNAVVSVEPVESVETVCIAVNHPSGCFLAGEALTPTHNSTIASGLGLYLLAGDGEYGAQVFAAAGAKEQAGLVFRPSKQMAETWPALKNATKRLGNVIEYGKAGSYHSYYRVVSSDGNLQHGYNVHGAVVDEVHVHKNPDLIDALETGTGSRTQPLVMFITTADDGAKGSIYDQKRDYLQQVASGDHKDPSFYGVVFGAAEEDDPFAIETIEKANPNIDVTIERDYLIHEATVAQTSPGALNRFLRLHLNIRTRSHTRWLNPVTWDECAGIVVEDELAGRDCYGGLDLSSTSDFSAWVLVFPDNDDGFDVLARFWLPRAALEVRSKMRSTLEGWERAGFLKVTEGDVLDYDEIERDIARDADRFTIREFAYDPWGATQMALHLIDGGLTGWPQHQQKTRLTAPCKELEILIGRRALRHGGNPVLRWMAGNVELEMDGEGNFKPSKKKSAEKIDGIAALVNALGAAIREREGPSIYEQRGLASL